MTTSLAKHTGFNRFTIFIFLSVSVYLVLPIVDIPVLGLSISAPIFFLIVLEAIFRPPMPWSKVYRPFIVLGMLIWAGIFLSASMNGLLSGGVDINTEGILTVIRYAYWLLIFIVVIYVVSVGKLFLPLSRVLGWSILILALLRWSEIFIFGNIGASSETHFLTQNDYGFQFSAFSPFLLGLALSQKGGKRTFAVIGYILLLGAVAINGSRGSWAGVTVGIAALLVILVAAGQRSFWGLFALLILTGSIAVLIFSASPQISQAVESRFNSLQNLDEEKS